MGMLGETEWSVQFQGKKTAILNMDILNLVSRPCLNIYAAHIGNIMHYAGNSVRICIA